MGKEDDTLAVVDTRARVYEAKGLRVLDASIFPVKPNGNTQAPAYGMAQQIFDLVSSEEYDHLFDCQKPPVLLSAKVRSDETHVKGSLCSVKNADYVISFYSDNQFIGKKHISTDKHGKAKFTAKLSFLPYGTEIRATATRTQKHQSLETSDLSNTVTVQ